jgi:hypothetical protein
MQESRLINLVSLMREKKEKEKKTRGKFEMSSVLD